MSTPILNIPFTLVGSNFHDSFVDSLKSNQHCTFTTVTTFAEYQAPADEHEVRVIVLNGHDDNLANETTLAALLGQSVVLALFDPSKQVVDALQNATKSLLHIPSVKLKNGTPMIIHRRPYDGVLSITPGFSFPTASSIHHEKVGVAAETSSEAIPDSDPIPLIQSLASALTIPTPEEQIVLNFAKSVEIIQLTVEYHLELLHKVRPRVDDRLTPPAGTNFYKTVEVPQAFPVRMGKGVSPTNPDQRYNYVSRLRMHAYCANAKPDAEFSQNGGVVHVFAVLSGQMARDRNYDPRTYFEKKPTSYMYWFADSASYEIGTSSLTGVVAEPQGGQTNGLDTTYDINFGTTLSLWTNSCSTMFDFPAKYQDTFIRTEFKQTVQSQQRGDYNVLFYYHNHYDRSIGYYDWENVFNGWRIKSFPQDNIPLKAFFAWRTPSLALESTNVVGRMTSALFWNTGREHRKTEHYAWTIFIPYTLDLANWEMC